MDKSKAVIGGMSCRLPQSDNLQEFWENLDSGKDMIGPSRWPKGLYNLPPRSGCLKHIKHFDGKFFGLSLEEANETNQCLRFLLEVMYECIVDSGIKLETLQSETTGCYIAYCFSDTDVIQTSQDVKTGKVNTGNTILSSAMSHFGLTGPGTTIDTACSSSLAVLNTACRDLALNRCKYAIVCGSHITDNPNVNLRFLRLSMLSPDGNSNVFDKAANGYVRSDGVAAILLSKKDVKIPRVYADIVNVAVNCDGYKSEGITYPSFSSQASLLTNVYHGISTNDIAYIEAHGTGTQAGDKSEAKSLASVLCKGRDKPLLVGSVKSNMGHCEVVAGLAGIIKCLLSIHHGRIPANLNLKTLNPEINELHNGEITVVSKSTPLPDGLLGANSFGFGGVNGHAILKRHKEEKCIQEHDVQLVLLTARTEKVFDGLVTFVNNNCNNKCLLSFINHSMISTEIRNNIRGYIILNDLLVDCKKIEKPNKRKMCLIVDFVAITPKADISNKNIEFIKKLNVANRDVLFNPDITGLAAKLATTLALVESLKCCGIKPDFVIGCGLGELVTAYIDGGLEIKECLQIIQTIENYIQNICTDKYPFYSVQIPLKLAYQLGPKVKVVTVKKEDEVIVMITAKDKLPSIYKDIHSKGGVYKYIGDYPPLFTSMFDQHKSELHKQLENIIIHPKLRSDSYLSSSHNSNNVVLDAAYFTDILTKPYNLPRTLQHLPNDTILVNVCIENNCSSDDTQIHCHPSSLLSTLGHLHMNGIDLNCDMVNDRCNRTLDCKAPPISNLIGWDHSKPCNTFEWHYYSAQVKDEPIEEYCFSVDHHSSIESLIIYHVWRAAMSKSEIKEDKSIKISFLAGNPHILYTGTSGIADVHILPGSKQFVVSACDCKSGNCSHIVCGSYELCDDIELPQIPAYDVDINQNVTKNDGEDDVQKTDIAWDDNWLEYLDNIVDFSSMTTKSDITRVFIDVKRQQKDVSECSNVFTMYEPSSGICKSGGVVLQFDVTKHLIYEKQHHLGNTDQKLPDTKISELSLCELKRGAMCLSYLGIDSDDDVNSIVGLIAIDEGEYGHQSVILPGHLLHLELFFPYCVAYYIIHDKLQLKEGQRILFFPPLVGVNLIMIWMALRRKCEVYVVSLDDNMKSVKELFPGIITVPVHTAGEIIKRKTKGKGCNACVSLADPFSSKYLSLDTTIDWLSDHGHFIIMDNPMAHGNSFGMGVFLRNITISILEPMQAVIKLLQRSSQEMKVLSAGLLDETFKKLSTLIYKEFSFPLTKGFDFSVPISLSLLVYITEEPGMKLEELGKGLSPTDIKQLDDLQDLITFIPQEYSLAQETLNITGQVSYNSEEDLFNNALSASCFKNCDLGVSTLQLPLCRKQPEMNLPVTPRLRIISISGTPCNSPIHASTPMPYCNVEIQLTPNEVEQSGLVEEHNCFGRDLKVQPRLGNPHLVHSPCIQKLRRKSSLSVDVNSKKDRTMNTMGLKLDSSKLKPPSSVHDLILMGPPRTPRTPQTEELLSRKFELTIVPLNDKTGQGIFIIHPIIGVVKIFKPLAEQLDIPVYGIQRTCNTPETSIKSIASYYINAIEMCDSEGPYTLVGYSYGGIISLEMAAQLQAKNKKIKHLILLDGSIDYVKSQIKAIYDEELKCLDESQYKAEDKFEVGCLLWFMAMFGPVKQKLLVYKALLGLDSQEARIEMAIDFLMGDVISSPCPRKTKWLAASHKIMQKKKKFINTAQEVIRLSREKKAREFLVAAKLADQYELAEKIQGDVHLLRIKTDLGPEVTLATDYGLSENCTGDVHLEFVEASHEGLLSAEKVKIVSDYVKKLLT